jgi:hypothetical protein
MTTKIAIRDIQSLVSPIAGRETDDGRDHARHYLSSCTGQEFGLLEVPIRTGRGCMHLGKVTYRD